MTSVRVLAATLAAMAALSAGAAQATTLVFDDFESYGATSHLNFTGFTGLTVTGGTVDYVHEPEYGLSTPYGSGMVDLDGSTLDGGVLHSATFNAHAGDVITFEFDASGNQRNGATDDLQFGFNGSGLLFTDISFQSPDHSNTFADGTYFLASDFVFPGATTPWGHYTFSFTAGNAGQFSAFVGTTSADNIGPVIDNFSLTTTGGGAAPEPATWAMLIIGFGGVGSALRRRRRLALAA
jgi:hypothetical protein